MKDTKDETIYTEDKLTIIRPTGSKIFNDDYERHEFWSETNEKVVVFIKKEK